MLAKYPNLWAWVFINVLFKHKWIWKWSKFRPIVENIYFVTLLPKKDYEETPFSHILSGIFALCKSLEDALEIATLLHWQGTDIEITGNWSYKRKRNDKSFEQVYYEVYKMVQERDRGVVKVHG